MREEEIVSFLRSHYQAIDTTNFGLMDFVHRFGSPRDALMYTGLFWPHFEEFHGMVFLKSVVETEDDKRRVMEIFRQNGNDRSLTERAANLTEVAYLFGARIGDTDETKDHLLAEILCEMWKSRLGWCFPDRSFQVEVIEPEALTESVAVSFFQNL